MNLFGAGGYLETGMSFQRNTFKNNLTTGASTREVELKWGAQNDGANGEDNAYEGNIIGEGANFLRWQATDYSTIATWEAAVAGAAENVGSDPLLTATSTNDFSLLGGSPAIDAGTTTALHTATSTDYLGNPVYGTPDIGALEYQPPYTIGTDEPHTTGSIRLYADGAYRQLTATSSSATANLSVAPEGGFGSGDYREYLDLAVTGWGTTKAWTATSIATTTIFTIGDLTLSGWYDVTVDGAASASVSGASCEDSTCQADGSGSLAFTYSGSWSKHTFALSAGSDPSPSTSGGGRALPRQTTSGE